MIFKESFYKEKCPLPDYSSASEIHLKKGKICQYQTITKHNKLYSLCIYIYIYIWNVSLDCNYEFIDIDIEYVNIFKTTL